MLYIDITKVKPYYFRFLDLFKLPKTLRIIKVVKII